MAARPNVLVFISHDTGRCVSPIGYPTFHTPACERLATEGITCTRMFSTRPLCSPARAALLTGRHPHQIGVDGLVGPMRGFRLHDDERHAARLFADAGYESVLCGQVHETDDCRTLGFERFLCGPGERYNDGGDLLDFGDGIGAWLRTRDPDRPFYLQIGCSDTHYRWSKRAGSDTSRGLWRPPYLKDLPAVREEVAAFQGGVRRLDEGIGRILAALDTAGLTDNTLCVFTTDHGEDFPLAKGTCRDPGIGVFCFLRYPAGGWDVGRTADALLSHVDVLPTLLEACGLAVPDRVAGRSFLPLLEGQPYEPNEAVFAGKTYHDTFDPRRAVRTDRWKYIRYLDLIPRKDVRAATLTRQHMAALETRVLGPEELYDLEADPDETTDLARDPAHAEVLAAMRLRLVAWMRSTDDPLLAGPVTCPTFARLRDELNAL